MPPFQDDRFMLKPLTGLVFISPHATRKFLCKSGRLKWQAGTKTLSIKTAIVSLPDNVLDSSSDEVTIVTTTEQGAARFRLSKGFAAVCESATAVRKQPLVFHYRIEGLAEHLPDEKEIT